MNPKAKQYGLVLIGIIATLHIGHTFIKPMLLPPNSDAKKKAGEELLQSLRKI